MIGIIGAMSVEIDGLVKKLENTSLKNIGRLCFISGQLGTKNIVVCRCGIGKVNAATAATLMITHFDVDLVVNIGVAGGVMPSIKQGDIVISHSSVQHDYAATADNMQAGQIAEYDFVYFESDKEALSLMQSVVEQSGCRYYKGVIATGDRFIEDKSVAQKLYTDFDAYACDMETAAIAHTCYILQKRFLAMRAISDNADGTAAQDFNDFVEKAAAKSIQIIIDFIKETLIKYD